MKFIYVMTEDDRDKLKSLGFRFISNQIGGMLWVFENDTDIEVSLDEELDVYVLSNTLMF